MIPIRDDVPSQRFAWATALLIATNVAAFLGELSSPRGLEGAVWAWGAVPYEFWTGRTVGPHGPVGPPWTVVTSMFLHGGFLHLGFNMLFLWIFGNDVEEKLGSLRYLVFYLVAGIAAGATQIFLTGPEPVPMVGASGAIAGVLGAFLVLFPRARVLALVPLFIFIEFLWVPAWIFLALWFVVQVLSSSGGGGGVAWHAHIGGFIAGLVLVWLFLPGRARAIGRMRRYRWS